MELLKRGVKFQAKFEDKKNILEMLNTHNIDL